jgi:hypothetical protein
MQNLKRIGVTRFGAGRPLCEGHRDKGEKATLKKATRRQPIFLRPSASLPVPHGNHAKSGKAVNHHHVDPNGLTKGIGLVAFVKVPRHPCHLEAPGSHGPVLSARRSS